MPPIIDLTYYLIRGGEVKFFIREFLEKVNEHVINNYPDAPLEELPDGMWALVRLSTEAHVANNMQHISFGLMVYERDPVNLWRGAAQPSAQPSARAE